jgi:2'-5' RNA ligase
MRLFVGIDLPAQLKETLVGYQAELRQVGVKGAWKTQENFHLTLEFLGELEPGRVTVIHQALLKGAEFSSSFLLNIGGLGAFPSLARPRVLWTGIGGSLPELNKLQSNIHRELLQSGFTLENRDFKSHITLAARPELPKIDLVDLKKKILGEFLVVKFALIESKVIRGKRIYTAIEEIKLS